MDKDKLKEILDKHIKWIRCEDGGVRADLCGADLCGANLRGADLREADLYGADLCGADLREANLRGADLREANLRGADLCGANLREAKYDKKIIEKFYPLCCPEVGEFIGWKKVVDNYLVKLKITEDAKRSSAYGRKCRCSKAEVLAIENIDGSKANVDVAYSSYDVTFVYKVGDVVEPRYPFNEDRFNECASGIHFFITRQEAVDYTL